MNTLHEWVESPKVVLTTELGPIGCTFIGDDETGRPMVSCHIDAHINDSAPAMVYRDQDYIGHIFLVDIEGVWTASGSVHWSRRPQWTDAPPTHAAALTKAVADAVLAFEYRHPEYVQAGRYAKAHQRLHQLDKELLEAQKLMTELRKEARKLLRVPEVTV